MGSSWFVISGTAFIVATLSFAISLIILLQILRLILPMLDETKSQIQDLGDLAANTVGRASETMEIVELRVSQAMGQANQGSAAATQQAIGIGSVLAGLYLTSRIATMVRGKRGKRR